MTCPQSPRTQVSLPPRPVLFPLFLIESPSPNIHLPLSPLLEQTQLGRTAFGSLSTHPPPHPPQLPPHSASCSTWVILSTGNLLQNFLSLAAPHLLPGWSGGIRTWPVPKAPSLTLHQLGCCSRGKHSVLSPDQLRTG